MHIFFYELKIFPYTLKLNFIVNTNLDTLTFYTILNAYTSVCPQSGDGQDRLDGEAEEDDHFVKYFLMYQYIQHMYVLTYLACIILYTLFRHSNCCLKCDLS